jgi:hypothetical protein
VKVFSGASAKASCGVSPLYVTQNGFRNRALVRLPVALTGRLRKGIVWHNSWIFPVSASTPPGLFPAPGVGFIPKPAACEEVPPRPMANERELGGFREVE